MLQVRNRHTFVGFMLRTIWKSMMKSQIIICSWDKQKDYINSGILTTRHLQSAKYDLRRIKYTIIYAHN